MKKIKLLDKPRVTEMFVRCACSDCPAIVHVDYTREIQGKLVCIDCYIAKGRVYDVSTT